MAFMRMREYSRDMDRNDDVIPQAISRAVDNQVQGGFVFEPQTGDTGVDTELRERMIAWADDPDECDITGEKTLDQIESLNARSEFVDGDIFTLTLASGQLQAVEAHRCRTPSGTKRNVVHGVLLDQGEHTRKPLEYWFCPDKLNPLERFDRVGDANRYAARDDDGHKQVLHQYKSTRYSQTRGVIWCHAVFDKASMYGDTDFAYAVKQQLSACVAWSWEKDQQFAGYGGDMQGGAHQRDAIRRDGRRSLRRCPRARCSTRPRG
jgi:capsid protein